MLPGLTIETLKSRGFEKEFSFRFSKSSGPGGQNVNKVNTKVELRFDIDNSLCLSEEEKQRIYSFASNRIIGGGTLLFTSQTSRSQLKNKLLVIEVFYTFLLRALHTQKKRKPGKPSRASKEKRLDKKKRISEIKKQRQQPKF